MTATTAYCYDTFAPKLLYLRQNTLFYDHIFLDVFCCLICQLYTARVVFTVANMHCINIFGIAIEKVYHALPHNEFRPGLPSDDAVNLKTVVLLVRFDCIARIISKFTVDSQRLAGETEITSAPQDRL